MSCEGLGLTPVTRGLHFSLFLPCIHRSALIVASVSACLKPPVGISLLKTVAPLLEDQLIDEVEERAALFHAAFADLTDAQVDGLAGAADEA